MIIFKIKRELINDQKMVKVIVLDHSTRADSCISI